MVTELSQERASEEKALEVLLVYFQELRSEINQRVGNHFRLVSAKVVTVGALLAFLLTQLPDSEADLRYIGLLLVPLVAALYDIMIAKNVKVIHELGFFIREEIEPSMHRFLAPLDGRAEPWLYERWHNEQAGKQDSWMKYRNYGRLDIALLTAFTLGTAVIAVVVLFSRNYEVLAVCAGVVAALLVLAVPWFMHELMVSEYDYGPDEEFG